MLNTTDKDILKLKEENVKLEEQVKTVIRDNLEMKRVLLNLFAKTYDYEIDELDGLKWLKVNTISDKTEQELKEQNEKENTIINYVLKIKKELE